MAWATQGSIPCLELGHRSLGYAAFWKVMDKVAQGKSGAWRKHQICRPEIITWVKWTIPELAPGMTSTNRSKNQTRGSLQKGWNSLGLPPYSTNVGFVSKQAEGKVGRTFP